MRIRISPSQIQKTILAPTMQQSIEVLLLPITELSMAIDQELQSNPLLEVDEERTNTEQEIIDRLLDTRFQNQQDSLRSSYPDNHDDEKYEEKQITKNTPLEDYLYQQLRLEINNPLEVKIGELIISELDEDGFFQSTCEDIAKLMGLENSETVERVLNTIQNFEPLGIASRDLKECLTTQAYYRFNGEAGIISKMINDHLEELGRKKYSLIAKSLNIPLEQVKEFALLVAKLEPKPARSYRPIEGNIYIKPDVTVTNEEDDLQVKVNNEYVPHLRISATYQKMLKQPNRTDEEKEFIKEKIKNALLFMKSIDQRNQTIKDIANYIVHYQKDFFEQGSEVLKPLTLKDVAKTIDRNESTVCRAIHNKYMDTPQGLFPFKFFFSQAINQGNDRSVSNRSIKSEIKTLIEEESKKKPLSDEDIRVYFENKGVKVARRTVSKYRQAMKVLPSHLRKV